MKFVKIISLLVTRFLINGLVLSTAVKSLMFQFIMYSDSVFDGTNQEIRDIFSIYYRGICKNPEILNFDTATLYAPLSVISLLFLPSFFYVLFLSIRYFGWKLWLVKFLENPIMFILPIWTSFSFYEKTSTASAALNLVGPNPVFPQESANDSFPKDTGVFTLTSDAKTEVVLFEPRVTKIADYATSNSSLCDDDALEDLEESEQIKSNIYKDKGASSSMNCTMDLEKIISMKSVSGELQNTELSTSPLSFSFSEIMDVERKKEAGNKKAKSKENEFEGPECEEPNFSIIQSNILYFLFFLGTFIFLAGDIFISSIRKGDPFWDKLLSALLASNLILWLWVNHDIHREEQRS